MSIDLDAIQARADAATEGPWEAAVYEYGMQDGRIRVTSPSDSGIYNLAEDVLPADADFIAAARSDVPALLAYARDLEARVGRVEALHQSSGGHNPACHCGVPAGSGANCIECGDVWPCPSITALTASDTP